MTTRTLQPGLRPALASPGLPPTLQPHAVLDLAPPTDHRRSLALSGATYALMGGALLWLGRAQVEAKPRVVTLGPTVLLAPAAAPALPAFHPPAPHPVPSLAQPPVVPSQTIPEVPTPLPSQDLSQQPPAAPPTSGTADTAATGGGPITLSGDAVRILHQVNPAYPAMAAAAHLQGQVVIRMTIDERGVPAQVEAVSGPQVFQEPALRAARQWRFEPARQDGQPVAASFLLTLNFVLR